MLYLTHKSESLLLAMQGGLQLQILLPTATTTITTATTASSNSDMHGSWWQSDQIDSLLFDLLPLSLTALSCWECLGPFTLCLWSWYRMRLSGGQRMSDGQTIKRTRSDDLLLLRTENKGISFTEAPWCGAFGSLTVHTHCPRYIVIDCKVIAQQSIHIDDENQNQLAHFVNILSLSSSLCCWHAIWKLSNNVMKSFFFYIFN